MWIEEKYINLLATRVRNFKKIDTLKYQCSCPICGDSKKFENRARGSFYVWNSEWFFHCYNCNRSYSLPVFLNFHYPDLFQDYLMETLQGKYGRTYNIPKKQKNRRILVKDIMVSDAKKVCDLPQNHMAVKYFRDRLLPERFQKDLLFVRAFKEWTNILIPNKFDNLQNDEPRLIIPFRTASGEVFAYQGRSFDPNSRVKYFTIKLDPEAPKVFGMHLIDPDKTVNIVEGPFDSMFIDNCVADAGGNLKRAAIIYSDIVSIWDNEPRNKQILVTMEKAITAGRKVVIWPDSIQQNDINDMVLDFAQNMPVENAIKRINLIIQDNTWDGLQAELRFARWRKS